MSEKIRTFGYGDLKDSAEQRNRVMRNTYCLLSLSLLPTVAGAWLGVATGITRALGGGLGMIVFLGGAFGFMYAIEKTKNSAAGVPVLLGFTFFMGLMLSRMIGFVLHNYSNGADLITIAFGGTAAILGVMASIATVSKRDFSGMGKWLFAGLLVAIVASVLGMVFHLAMLQVVVSVVVIGIFSAYILYDVQQVINGGGQTVPNYIRPTYMAPRTIGATARYEF